MPQLICKNLTLGYEGKIIISNLSFTINSGDYLCIVGENGSGKSTLMKTILKLKKPMSGKITADDDFRSGVIGYLPQQTAIQKDFPASVREVVRSGCLNHCGIRPWYNKNEKKMAENNMEKLGISNIAKLCYRELSGGQQQRALLARALCAVHNILFLDEPSAGLDPKAANDMYELIADLNKNGTSGEASRGKTILMISHDIPASIKYASHILHIGEGLPLFFGTKAEYLKSETGRKYTGMDEASK